MTTLIEEKLTKKVSPIIQFGLPEPASIFVPPVISNTEPRHSGLVADSLPKIMSCGSMAHDLPPNESETDSLVAHAMGDRQ